MARPLLTARSTSLGMWPGGVGVGGKNQDHYFGDVDGFDDGFAV
jgi:hypothetical protein